MMIVKKTSNQRLSGHPLKRPPFQRHDKTHENNKSPDHRVLTATHMVVRKEAIHPKRASREMGIQRANGRTTTRCSHTGRRHTMHPKGNTRHETSQVTMVQRLGDSLSRKAPNDNAWVKHPTDQRWCCRLKKQGSTMDSRRKMTTFDIQEHPVPPHRRQYQQVPRSRRHIMTPRRRHQQPCGRNWQTMVRAHSHSMKHGEL